MLPNPPLMLITDAAQAVMPVVDIIAQSLKAGCKWIVVRDIGADDTTLFAQAQAIKNLCTSHKAKCFVSRSIKVANAVQADGLHLSASQDLKEARTKCGNIVIGKSCHTEQDVVDAEAQGADYVTLSPIFETVSKSGYGPTLGIDMLQKVCARVKLPVIALGGIGANAVQPCLKAGARGIAVMGSIMRNTDPRQCMQELLQRY